MTNDDGFKSHVYLEKKTIDMVSGIVREEFTVSISGQETTKELLQIARREMVRQETGVIFGESSNKDGD